jgi:hypothetical protein
MKEDEKILNSLLKVIVNIGKKILGKRKFAKRAGA